MGVGVRVPGTRPPSKRQAAPPTNQERSSERSPPPAPPPHSSNQERSPDQERSSLPTLPLFSPGPPSPSRASRAAAAVAAAAETNGSGGGGSGVTLEGIENAIQRALSPSEGMKAAARRYRDVLREEREEKGGGGVRVASAKIAAILGSGSRTGRGDKQETGKRL